MNVNKYLIKIFFIFLLTHSFLVHAKPLRYDEDIHRLLTLLGAKNFISQGVKVLIENTKDEQLRSKLNRFLLESNTEQFDNLLVSVYQKYLTEDDIAELIKFYESPTGKKIIKLELLVIQNSSALDEEHLNKHREKIYKEHMTEEDNIAVKKFLNSEAEQKYLNVEPYISDELEKLSIELIEKIIHTNS